MIEIKDVAKNMIGSDGSVLVQDVRIEDILIEETADRPVAAGGCTQEQLQASIASPLGLLQSVVLRLTEAGKFSVAAGRRRVKACRALGWKTIPARVLLPDETLLAAQATLTENHIRGDFHPLDLAERIAKARAAGLTCEDIAVGLGVTPGEVAQAQRLAGLHPTLKAQALKIEARGMPVRWTAALEVARLPETIQAEVMGYFRWRDGIFEATARELRETIERVCRRVKAAPWPEKWTAETLRACAGCAQRTDVQGLLFADLADKKGRAEARCLDPKCWEAKRLAWLMAKAATLKSADGNIILTSREYLSDAETGSAMEAVGSGARFVNSYRAQAAKKSDPDAVQALEIDTGRTVWIQKPTARQAVSGARRPGPRQTVEEKRKDLDGKRWRAVLRALAEEIGPMNHQAAAETFGAARLMSLISVRAWQGDIPPDTAAVILHGDPETPEDMLSRCWSALCHELCNCVLVDDDKGPVGKALIDLAEEIADRLGHQVVDMYNDASDDLPEPKSWAKQEVVEGQAKAQQRRQEREATEETAAAVGAEAGKATTEEGVGTAKRGRPSGPMPVCHVCGKPIRARERQDIGKGLFRHIKCDPAGKGPGRTAKRLKESKPDPAALVRQADGPKDPLGKVDAALEELDEVLMKEDERIRKDLAAARPFAHEGTPDAKSADRDGPPPPVEAWAYTNGETGMAERIYDVRRGLKGSSGWATAWHRRDGQPYMRVKDEALPNRPTAKEAQEDLDRWASATGLTRCCAECGCTDDDCSQCMEKTAEPCHWTRPGLCSACATAEDSEGPEVD